MHGFPIFGLAKSNIPLFFVIPEGGHRDLWGVGIQSLPPYIEPHGPPHLKYFQYTIIYQNVEYLVLGGVFYCGGFGNFSKCGLSQARSQLAVEFPRHRTSEAFIHNTFICICIYKETSPKNLKVNRSATKKEVFRFRDWGFRCLVVAKGEGGGLQRGGTLKTAGTYKDYARTNTACDIS